MTAARHIGRIGTAPCGHRGEAVVGQYYRCLEGCEDNVAGVGAESDGVPEEIEPERTQPICPHCGGDEAMLWPPDWRDAFDRDFWLCEDATCGKSFHA